MFPALFVFSIGLLIGDLAHHWLYNWAFWWDTWIILSIASLVLFFAWWHADDDMLMESKHQVSKKHLHY